MAPKDFNTIWERVLIIWESKADIRVPSSPPFNRHSFFDKTSEQLEILWNIFSRYKAFENVTDVLLTKSRSFTLKLCKYNYNFKFYNYRDALQYSFWSQNSKEIVRLRTRRNALRKKMQCLYLLDCSLLPILALVRLLMGSRSQMRQMWQSWTLWESLKCLTDSVMERP